MKKIPCLFKIDHEKNVAINELNPKAAFLFDHEDAIATIKKDGTAVKFVGGEWFTRRAVKPGKNAPVGFVLEETDPNTGTSFGWEPMETSGFKKFLKEAIANLNELPDDGTTLELCAPKINGNAENVNEPTLMIHGADVATGFPTIGEIGEHLDDLMGVLLPHFESFRAAGIEGIVWWVDGKPAVKARVKDFFPELDGRFKA